jgi:AcrR family transcriptional regulator
MMKRIGRRRGSPDTRESILEVARRLFADKGFDATTVRAIASDAGVDPAMIHHYFGTKEELFRQSLSIPFDPTTEIPKIVAEGLDRAGENLIRMFIGVWDSPLGGAGAALIRSAMSNEWTTRLLREFISTQILRRVIAELELDPAEAPLRASLVASQLAGLAMMRYIVKLEPIASLPVEDLVRAIGPNVQRYITGSLDAA